MKKIISMLLIAATLLSAGFTVGAITMEEYESAANDMLLYDESSARGFMNVGNDATGEHNDAGQFFRADKPFSSLYLSCASWYDSIGNLTATLYAWKGDYNSTVASEPLHQKEWVNVDDNSYVTIDAPDGGCFNEGEYFWTLTNPTQRVGVFHRAGVNPKSDIMQQSYVNGEVTHLIFESFIKYYTGSNIVAEDHENIIMSTKSNKVFVEGKTSYLDVAPKIVNGRTLVPLRFVAENLGATVEYSDEDKAVAIESDNKTITITIGDNEMFVNGKIVVLDAPAVLENGRTLVPIRAVAEVLGNRVQYFDNGVIVIGRAANIFNPVRAQKFAQLF